MHKAVDNDSREANNFDLNSLEKRSTTDNTGNSFIFSNDPRMFCSKFLNLVDRRTVVCHKNCTRSNQGTVYLDPPVKWGECKEITFHVENKPGRMCYFFGVVRAAKLFNTDSGQATIRQNSISLENLYGSMHCESPSTKKSLPSFHTGSILKMIVDRTDTAKNQMTVTISIMKTGQSFRANFQADKRARNNVVPFVSMYNKDATIKIVG